MCSIEISCRVFKLAAGLDTVGFIAHDAGPDDVAVRNESIYVICGNLRVIEPLREELMMNDRRRDKGSKAIKDARGFLARLDVLKIELEEVEYRRTVGNRGALKHASKCREAGRTGRGKAGWAMATEGGGGGGRELLWNMASNW